MQSFGYSVIGIATFIACAIPFALARSWGFNLPASLLAIVIAWGIAGLGAAPVIIGQNFIEMGRNPNTHYFPSVTTCRLCNKRVFVWQGHERRDMNMELDNPDGIMMAVSGSCIVHKNCKGTPKSKLTAKIGK